MIDVGRREHWEKVYAEKGERQVGWFQESPTVSLDLIRTGGATQGSAIVDIGGGAAQRFQFSVFKRL